MINAYFSSNVSSRSFIRECSSALDMVDVDMSSFGKSAMKQNYTIAYQAHIMDN